MENIGEKIKAFTSDREKVQALASDATFMNKVSGGSVTPEDTMKKFSELGLPLTTEDAQTVNKTTSNILTAIPSLKLNDEILDNVSGGVSTISGVSFIVGSGGILGSLGCGIASAVYHYKAGQAAKKGDKNMLKSYEQTAKFLGTSSKICGVTGATLMTVSTALTAVNMVGQLTSDRGSLNEYSRP